MAATRLRHLRLVKSEKTYSYTAHPGGGGEFQRPPRDRAGHSKKLKQDLSKAEIEALSRGFGKTDDKVLTYELQPNATPLIDSLERETRGIRLLSVVTTSKGIRATVRVPESKLRILHGILDQYATQLHKRSGRPMNQDLVESVDAIRLATERDLWTDSEPFPPSDRPVWWEIWLTHERLADPKETFLRFRALAVPAGLELRERYVLFPDRLVTIGFGRFESWVRQPLLLLHMAELRRAKELASEYIRVDRFFQNDLIRDLAKRTTQPSPGAPAVCLLDTGVDRDHPLLKGALSPSDTQALRPNWGVNDHHKDRHGTTMAGIALYDSLKDALDSREPIELTHRLESVKILPPNGANDPDNYGSITQEALGRAEANAPDRNRVACLTVTTDSRDGGRPSSWSAALDELAAGGDVFGDPHLICVSAGNLRNEILAPNYRYPMLKGKKCGIEDPGQAWNVLTVGAITNLAYFDEDGLADYRPIAKPGDLSPTSRTSLAWPEDIRDGWALKPDIVMEGGNWAESPKGSRDTPDGLGLLTTIVAPNGGGLLTTTRDTSPATAGASRLAAQIWAQYPDLWPETVRGLLVHSARWTDAMKHRFPGNDKGVIQKRLRCYGFGVPDRSRALHSVANAVTLIFEGTLRPYKKEDGSYKTDEMHLHKLPWPVETLRALGETDITMRVTLSYFIEPSPGRRGWTNRHCYASHGLRFELQRPLETDKALLHRLSTSALEDAVGIGDHSDEKQSWTVGSKGRTQGSIHCDWWQGTAAGLAACQHLAVYPVTGWWRQRPHLDRLASKARYSLIVGLETESADLYTDIANEVAIMTEVERQSR
jgi:hypothetical protein